MKKILKILIMTVMLLSLGACVNESGVPGESHEIETCESLEELNDLLDVALVKMPVMGVSEENFLIVDDVVAEYDFILNGYQYCFRASRILDEDISGVYVDGEAAFSDFTSDFSTNLNDPEYKTGRFVIDEVQYCLTVKDSGGMAVGTYSDILNEAMDVVAEKVFAEQTHELEGSYYDRFSARANAQVTLIDDNELVVDVTWSNSSSEYEEWIMFVKYDGTRLSYDEVIHTTVSFTRDGEVTIPDDDYGAGYFEVQDGLLYWTGSGNELTDKCVFEKAN